MSAALVLLAPGWLVLVALAALPWVWPRGPRDARHAALRASAIALVALALARPAWRGVERAQHHVFVLDASASLSPSARRAARAGLAARADALPSTAQRTLVWFGAPPAPEEGFDPARYPRVLRVADGGGSPLAAALERAARAIPDRAAGAITLATDGRATDRRHARVSAELAARGVPVHVLRVSPPEDDLALVGLEAAGELRVGQGARIVATVAGATGRFDLVLRAGDRELARREGLRCDGRARVALEFEPPRAGFEHLELRLERVEAPDARPENNSLARTFGVRDPLRVLYLGERVLGAAERLGEMLGRGFQLSEGADAEALPFARWDAVVLDDRPARSLAPERQRELVDAVVDSGVGLLVAGGQASFGPGGWHETALAEVLPVESVQKQEKRDPSTTLVVIIDTSGSMGGNRVQLAKEVSRLAMRRLLPHDKVGIVEFYGAKRWAAPIQPASNTIELQRALNRLDAGGGTVILPAIEEAFYALQNVNTRYKHVLVLTDGGVERGSFESLIRRMADEGMTVSTVLVGPDAHSEFLVSISNWGKGRFYSVPNRFNLPEVVLKSPTDARLPAYRAGPHTVRARAGRTWWDGEEPADLPALSGYVETRRRPGAEVALETAEGAHPVLASWQYGLGRVTALTSEATGAGTAGWQDWPGYAELLERALARGAGDAAEPFAFELERDGTWITLGARRRGPGDARPSAERVEPQGPPLAFHRRADDRFEARFPHDPEAELRLLAGAADDPLGRRAPLVSDARADLAGEHAVDPARALDLAGLAAATGAELFALDDPAPTGDGLRPRTGGAAAPPRLVALWPLCFALALLFYLADLAWRRRPGARIRA